MQEHGFEIGIVSDERVAQQVAEQCVVTEPAAATVEGDEEHRLTVEQIEHALTVAVARHRVAQRRGRADPTPTCAAGSDGRPGAVGTGSRRSGSRRPLDRHRRTCRETRPRRRPSAARARPAGRQRPNPRPEPVSFASWSSSRSMSATQRTSSAVSRSLSARTSWRSSVTSSRRRSRWSDSPGSDRDDSTKCT